MTLVPIMWSVWGSLVLILAGIWLYRSRLERDEEDQIFIDDAFSNERNAQAAIVQKVGKVQPVLRLFKILTVVATVFVVGYYIYDILNQFK